MTNQPILPIIFNNFLSFDNVLFRRLLIPDWVIFAIDAYHGRVEKYSYTEVREERDQLKQKVEDHDREIDDLIGQFAGAIKGITQQLSEIKSALDEQRETKIKELRHQITVAAEAALANTTMTVREWTSLHEIVDEYVNKYHQNWYVKPLIAKVDRDVHVVGRLDEHGNDIVE